MLDSKSPDFSIITPTYKRPDLLRRAINSVRNQTFGDYEHIIIDDGNDQETKRLVSEFNDKKIIFHQHSTRKGAAAGYNSGINLAKGQFILFLDDDDEYMPLFLERMKNHFMQTGGKTGFIWTGVSIVRDTESGELDLYSKVWPSKFKDMEAGLIAATTIGNGYGLCVRKECIELIGMYDESIQMGHDADFLFRLVKHFNFETIPLLLVKIHQHDEPQLTDVSNNLKRLELRQKILLRHNDLLRKYSKLYSIHYRHIANLSYGLNLRKKGREAMLGIIKRSPFNVLNFFDLVFYELFEKDFFSALHLRQLKKFVSSE